MAGDVVHVVDDDVDVRKSLGFLLATADFAVRLHESATAFLATEPKEIDGCIVTDVRMPGGSGTELLDAVLSRSPGTPVLMMTGYGTVAEAVAAMKRGAVDYLTKPVDWDEVVLMLERALEQALDEDFRL